MRGVDFSNAKTTVFWDVDDFPFTDYGHSICDRIKKALLSEGYRGGVDSIKAYGEKEPDNLSPDDDDDDDDGGGVIITFTRKSGNPGRLKSLIFEIGLWALNFECPRFVPENLMIIAKINHDEVELVDYLLEMHVLKAYCNVVLVVDDDNIGPAEIRLAGFLSEIWSWNNLLAGSKALDYETIERLADQPTEGLTLRDTFSESEDGEEYDWDVDGEGPCCPECQKKKECN